MNWGELVAKVESLKGTIPNDSDVSISDPEVEDCYTIESIQFLECGNDYAVSIMTKSKYS